MGLPHSPSCDGDAAAATASREPLRDVKTEKNEPPETDSNPRSTKGLVSEPAIENTNESVTKRKEREKKVEGSSKKSKSIADETFGDGEKLPYVGQATDSHSLAEEAARMKRLQELLKAIQKERAELKRAEEAFASAGIQELLKAFQKAKAELKRAEEEFASATEGFDLEYGDRNLYYPD